MNRVVASTLLLLFVVSACAGARTRRRDLKDAVHSYNVAIRWGHIQKASVHIPPKKRPEFIARKRAALAHMRIHEVNLRNVSVSSDQSAAKVLVQVAFSVGADPIIRTHVVEQQWRYRDEGWLLISKKRIKQVKARDSKPGDLY